MSGFQCATCGQYHDELPMRLGPSAPAMWFSIAPDERATRAELSSDQCVIDGQHFFILGRIIIPVNDSPDLFVWLAWVSLSEQSFARVCELWDSEGRESEPPYFGWLQSELPYPVTTMSLKTSVQTMARGDRPMISVEPGSHEISEEQKNGVTMARIREFAEAALHG